MASYRDSAVTSIACAVSFRSWTTTVQALSTTMAIYHIRYLFAYRANALQDGLDTCSTQ